MDYYGLTLSSIPRLFFKRISDVYDEEYESALKESGNDKEYASLKEFHRFIIPKNCHWKDIRETSTNVGSKILTIKFTTDLGV